MELGIRGKTCLVTGASTGIGRATAMLLSSEGARVVIVARNTEKMAELTETLTASGAVPPIPIAADLGHPRAAADLADKVRAQVGHVDVLVNNAGGSRPMARPDDEDVWEESFQLNFTSARELGERLAPAMAERGWGRIVNVTGAIVGKSLNAAAPAKAALESWSRGTAALYARQGVTVNCVAPGRFNTPQILERLHPTAESRQEFIERNIPAGRFGEPHEAAAVIAFLASEAAAFVNGVTIPVDGGSLRFAF